MAKILLAFGLVLVVEGLVFALAPSRIEEALDLMRKLAPETRRAIGLLALAVGVFLVWLAQTVAA